MKLVLLGVLLFLGASSSSWSMEMPDREVREFLVRESLLHYVGYCPCPYHYKNNGESCGRDSGYDRTGGRLPVCYPTDVTDEMILEFRQKVKRETSMPAPSLLPR